MAAALVARGGGGGGAQRGGSQAKGAGSCVSNQLPAKGKLQQAEHLLGLEGAASGTAAASRCEAQRLKPDPDEQRFMTSVKPLLFLPQIDIGMK